MSKCSTNYMYYPLHRCKGGPYETNHNAHRFLLICANDNCFYPVGCEQCLEGLQKTQKSKGFLCLFCKRRLNARFVSTIPLVEIISVLIVSTLIMLWLYVYFFKQ
jgi:hypothetical protein